MRIACVQTDLQIGKPERNAQVAVEHMRTLRTQQVDLAVFPEAYLTGYCVDSVEEAKSIALPITSNEQGEVVSFPASVGLMQRACQEIRMHVVVGLASSERGTIRNSALLIEPSGRTRIYSKTHLPCLGLDRFAAPGECLTVFDTEIGRIGILICYDMRPPEPARVLALRGADLLVLPTNWPEGAEISMKYIGIARAAESKVFVATCNRVGVERGFTFIGGSKIIAPSGKVLAEAGASAEVISADLDLTEARQKRTVNAPGKYELDIIGCRRPELYSSLTS